MTHNALDAATVRLRWLSLEERSEQDIRRWRATLDAEEIARADRFYFEADRDAYVAAHALLRTMLSEAFDLAPPAWRYIDGPNGKPAIAPGLGDGSIKFNVSHTRGLVACALARDVDIGVDVEATDRQFGDFASVCRSFSSYEASLVLGAPEDQQPSLFFRLWTLKEAFVKATGEGLARRLDSFSIRFDPVRVVFHSHCRNAEVREDARQWQFEEFRPVPHLFLALAICRGRAPPLVVDASAA